MEYRRKDLVCFYILTQWNMFIKFVTKRITAINAVYQLWTMSYGFAVLAGNTLILWSAIGHKKTALCIEMG